MSYDFSGRHTDSGGGDDYYVDPFFDDTHPAFTSDGMAGNVLITERGHARCGNYTSNVSGMWADCLTAAAQQLGEPYTGWMGADARAYNATGATVSYPDGDGGWISGPMRERNDRLTLRDLKDRPCGDLVALLALAVEWGVEHIDELHEQDPKNGWGNADGAVTYLWDLQRFCEANPTCDLYLSS